jgi:serine/threonine protein kinase
MKVEIVIAGQFKITKKISEGSFGEIFEAINVKRGHKVAVKLEHVNSKYPQLLHEARVLIDLSGNDSVTDKGIPSVYSKGT